MYSACLSSQVCAVLCYVTHLSSGFCMDLLNRLAEKVNFTFDVHLSEDGSYGSLRRVSPTQSYTKMWLYDVDSQS